MDKIIVLILFIFSKVSSRNLTKLYEDARLIDEAIAKNTKHHYIHPIYEDDEDNIRIINDTGDDVGNPGGDDDDIPFFRDYPHDDPKTKYEVEAIVGNKTVQLCDAMVQDPYFNQELDDSPIYKTYAKPWANHTGMILNSIIEICKQFSIPNIYLHKLAPRLCFYNLPSYITSLPPLLFSSLS